jgi:carboxyl-terminal processing protease
MINKHILRIIALIGSGVCFAESVTTSPFLNPQFMVARNKVSENVDQNRIIDTEKDIYQWFKTYSEVVSLAEKRAFRTVDFSRFIQDSLKAAAGEIDAHSAFLTQENYKAIMESASGEFSGIGVSIISKSNEDDVLVVVDVIPGGPADKAGLRAGDKVVEVDGTKLKGLSTDEVISKLKGKVGSVIKVKILRNKKPMEYKVTRDVIKDQNSNCYLFKNHRIYYLSLKMFTETAASQVADLLKIANEGKCKGIILDLRRNPGGTLQSAIEMSGLFLDKGSLVAVTKDRDRKVVDKYYTTTDPLLKADVPIFVLIDNFTASAAEILAGSLRHHSMHNAEKGGKRARNLMVFLLGVPSFGKGSVQEVIPISNGCALKLTTMLYYLADDVSIQATGIEPDFLIKPKLVPVDELKWISEMYGKETSLKRHITFKEATEKEGKKEDKEAVTDEKSTEEVFVEKDDADLDDDDDETVIKNDEKGDKKDDGEKHKKWEEKMREELGHDVQIQASINMINLFDFARKAEPKAVSSRQRAIEFLKQHYLTDDKVEVEKVK